MPERKARSQGPAAGFAAISANRKIPRRAKQDAAAADPRLGTSPQKISPDEMPPDKRAGDHGHRIRTGFPLFVMMLFFY